MRKPPRRKSNDLVPHPRYGDRVIPSGSKIPESVVRSGFWRYSSEFLYPESALEADLSRQNWTTFPRRYYVDILKKCRTCKRYFLFFAKEQQYWYEELRFFIDADCVHCPECRLSDQKHRRRVQRYNERISKKDLTDREFATLIGDAVYLWNAGVLQSEQKLRRLRNQARRQIPGYAETNLINKLIQSMEQPS